MSHTHRSTRGSSRHSFVTVLLSLIVSAGVVGLAASWAIQRDQPWHYLFANLSPKNSQTLKPAPQQPGGDQQLSHHTSQDTSGMTHSDTAPSGVYYGTTLNIAPKQQGKLNRYFVQVEDTVGVDANAAAREIQLVLDDPRGWSSVDGQVFQLVSDPNQADFVLSIASPTTTDRKCLPLDTEGTWSCRVYKTVNLNSDRWLYATPTWQHESIQDYRAYMINHEVGHFIGHDHVGCPGPGQPAPVMMQQSIDIQGCVTNAWPNPANTR